MVKSPHLYLQSVITENILPTLHLAYFTGSLAHYSLFYSIKSNNIAITALVD